MTVSFGMDLSTTTFFFINVPSMVKRSASVVSRSSRLMKTLLENGPVSAFFACGATEGFVSSGSAASRMSCSAVRNWYASRSAGPLPFRSIIRSSRLTRTVSTQSFSRCSISTPSMSSVMETGISSRVKSNRVKGNVNSMAVEFPRTTGLGIPRPENVTVSSSPPIWSTLHPVTGI